MKRLNQVYLHPKLEVPGLAYPNPELNLGLQWKEHTWKSHWNSFLIAIRNIYKWVRNRGECSRHDYPLCMCYMSIQENTWTAVGCRPNSTFKVSAKTLPAAKTSSSPRIHCQAGHIMLGSPLWRDLTKVISILNSRFQDWHVLAGNETQPPHWEASTLEKTHLIAC